MGLTIPSLYAPGDTITSAWANTLRTDFSLLDARTGGDPAASGKLLTSNGATSATWVDALTEILAALGYTPANKAGDTFGGTVTVNGALTATGAMSAGSYTGGSTGSGVPSVLGLNTGANGVSLGGGGAGSGVLFDAAGIASVLHSHFDRFIVANASGLSFLADITAATAAFLGQVTGASAAFTGAVSAASAAISGALSAASAAISGQISSTAAGPAVGNTMYSSSHVHLVATGNTAPAIGFERSGVSATTLYELANKIRVRQADGVDGPLAVLDGSGKVANAVTADTANAVAAGSVTDTGVASANKDGATGTYSMRTLGTGAQQAAAGNHAHSTYAKIASGGYSGSASSGRQITTGFTCKAVLMTGTSGSASVVFLLLSTTAAECIGLSASPAQLSHLSVTHLDSSDGFWVGTGTDSSDNSGATYNWIALG
jgi:trimeric autotransporter adhesin